MNAVHPLTEKARAATVPIAELLGFLVEEVAGGRAIGSMRAGPQHAHQLAPPRGVESQVVFLEWVASREQKWSTSGERRRMAMARRYTPQVARRWGYLMNMSVDSFRTLFDKFARLDLRSPEHLGRSLRLRARLARAHGASVG